MAAPQQQDDHDEAILTEGFGDLSVMTEASSGLLKQAIAFLPRTLSIPL